MATDDKTTDAQGDGAPATPPPGIPDPNPTVPDTPVPAPDATSTAPDLPDASIEPAAQAVAGTSETPETVAPPLPADYEMPDDYAAQDPIETAKQWVESNPGLAILGAAGIGLLAGRLVMGLFPDPEPPSIGDRVEKRARQLQKEAKKRGKSLRKDAYSYKKQAAAFADDAGDTLQDSLHRAAEALREAAGSAGDYAEEGYEKTKDLADTIADAAKVAVTGVLATKIDDWVKKVRD